MQNTSLANCELKIHYFHPKLKQLGCSLVEMQDHDVSGFLFHAGWVVIFGATTVANTGTAI